MSIKITTESISFNDAQARIKLDSTGKMQFVGESDHKDIELRQTQFGALNTKGGTINDGGGPSSTDVRFSMQSKETGIPGGAFVFRPEFSDLAYLGKDFVRNAFTFKGTGSAAMILNAISANGVRGDANFTVEAHSEFPSLATQLFTVNELKKYKFHGSDGILTVEGKSSLSGSQILSASNANNKPAANFEIDATSTQVAGFQIGMSGEEDSINNNSDLLSYYNVSNSMFDTSSAASSFMAYGALGVQIANNPNVIIENGVVSTNGTISSSMVIGRIGQPANAMFENGEVTISQGTIIRVLLGSKFIIQDQQPDITADSDTGTITISDPTVDGGGDVIINPNNGGNPTLLQQSITIPSNTVANWTVGDNIPGTFVNNDGTPPSNPSTGIQIGGSSGALFNGVFINGEEIYPAYGATYTPFNIKLIIEEGAQLHIENESQITTDDEGNTTITGTTIVEEMAVGGFDNDIAISSSITLSNALHGMGRILLIRSGAGPHYDIDHGEGIIPIGVDFHHPWTGLPYNNPQNQGEGQYRANPAGIIEVTLPAATVGLSFDIYNCGKPFVTPINSGQSAGQYPQSYLNSYYGSLPNNGLDLVAPTLLVSPSSSQSFIFDPSGAPGAAGKGIQMLSQSLTYGGRLHITCQTENSWSIINMNGNWIAES